MSFAQANWMMAAAEETADLASKAALPEHGELSLTHLRVMATRKLGRWLGWMQAAVVYCGGATLADMKAMNRRLAPALKDGE